MTPEQRDLHRSRIGFEVEVIMQGYWVSDHSPEVRAAIFADWADELEDWRPEQVRWALREWRRDNPSKRPNPGHISALLKRRRGLEVAARMRDRQADPVRKPITADEAARRSAQISEILGSLGRGKTENGGPCDDA